MRKIKAVPTTPQSTKVLGRATAHNSMSSLLDHPVGPIVCVCMRACICREGGGKGEEERHITRSSMC